MQSLERPFHSSSSKAFALAAALCSCCACSLEPIRDAASLAPAVKGSAIADDMAFAEANDQILLTNILRARDGAPLNMGTLASMNGALGLQTSLGASFPFGYGLHLIQHDTSSPPLSSVVDTFSPSITASTSPTYTFTPLNTQTFTLNILQPISPAYVLSGWNGGISRELLMLLFVKEIDFPEAIDGVSKKNGVQYVKYINNPDNPQQFRAFESVVHTLLSADGELRSFDVLDPVGPPYNMYAPLNLNSTQEFTHHVTKEKPIKSDSGAAGSSSHAGTIPAPGPNLEITPGAIGSTTTKSDQSDKGQGTDALKNTYERETQTTVSASLGSDRILIRQPNQTAFGTVTSNNDGQYHFGNSSDDDGNSFELGQLYRVYASQVALCVSAGARSMHDFPIVPLALPKTSADVAPPPVLPIFPVVPHHRSHRHVYRNAQTERGAIEGTTPIAPALPAQVTKRNLTSDMVESLRSLGLSAHANFSASTGGSGGATGGTASASRSGAATSGSATGSSSGGASQATTAALQAQRYSSIVDNKVCGAQEIVLPQHTEEDFQLDSQGFVHMQWRSISEIIDYLGAVLRYQQREGDFQFTDVPTAWVAAQTGWSPNHVALCALHPEIRGCAVEAQTASKLFDLPVGLSGAYHVNYGTAIYSVPDPSPNDQTAQALSMLGMLINVANSSSSVTSTTPFQLLPVP